MTVGDVLWIVVALVVGAALGLFYFGGLWLTLQRLPGSRSPHTLALASFFGRTAVVVGGIFAIGSQSWQRVAACLAGFVAVRMVMIHKLKPPPSDRELRRAERDA